jgi:hypothetical protein
VLGTNAPALRVGDVFFAKGISQIGSALRNNIGGSGVPKPLPNRPRCDLMRGSRCWLEDCPPGTLTSLPFAEILAQAIAEGRVSVRRAAGLVSLTIEDLADLFRRNGIEVPFDV